MISGIVVLVEIVGVFRFTAAGSAAAAVNGVNVVGARQRQAEITTSSLLEQVDYKLRELASVVFCKFLAKLIACCREARIRLEADKTCLNIANTRDSLAYRQKKRLHAADRKFQLTWRFVARSTAQKFHVDRPAICRRTKKSFK